MMEILFIICFCIIALSVSFILFSCIAERKDKRTIDATLQMLIFENKQAIDTLKNENEALKRDIEHLKNFTYATRRNKDEP